MKKGGKVKIIATEDDIKEIDRNVSWYEDMRSKLGKVGEVDFVGNQMVLVVTRTNGTKDEFAWWWPTKFLKALD